MFVKMYSHSSRKKHNFKSIQNIWTSEIDVAYGMDYGTECARSVSVDPVLQNQGVRKFVAVLH